MAVSDSAGKSATASYRLLVEGTELKVETTWLERAQAGVAYSAVLSVSGGTAPYQWYLEQGGLPAGLTLARDGRIQGTPTESGPFGLGLMVVDADTRVARQTLVLTVAPAVQSANQVFADPAELQFRLHGRRRHGHALHGHLHHPDAGHAFGHALHAGRGLGQPGRLRRGTNPGFLLCNGHAGGTAAGRLSGRAAHCSHGRHAVTAGDCAELHRGGAARSPAPGAAFEPARHALRRTDGRGGLHPGFQTAAPRNAT